MKYKLINTETNEEHLCGKATIDGFDYYVSDELPKDSEGYWIYIGFNQPLEVVKSNQPQGWFEKLWDKANYKTPIATNNPTIDIPKVIDEVEELAKEATKIYVNEREKQTVYLEFINGYNKSKETHPFTEEDMIEFAEWRGEHIKELNQWKVDGLKGGDKFTTQELLAIWKEQQQPKTVYYR